MLTLLVFLVGAGAGAGAGAIDQIRFIDGHVRVRVSAVLPQSIPIDARMVARASEGAPIDLMDELTRFAGVPARPGHFDYTFQLIWGRTCIASKCKTEFGVDIFLLSGDHKCLIAQSGLVTPKLLEAPIHLNVSKLDHALKCLRANP